MMATSLTPITGTANVTNGSTTVEVIAPLALSALNCAQGANVSLGRAAYFIGSDGPTDTTHFELEAPYEGTTGTVSISIGQVTPEMTQRIALSRALQTLNASALLIAANQAGLSYSYTGSTAAPASGQVALNNADPTAATIIKFAEADLSEQSVADRLGQIGAGDEITIRAFDGSARVSFLAAGAAVDEGSYQQVAVTYLGGAGVLAASAQVVVERIAKGAHGTDANLQTSQLDTTATHALTPGAFGLGKNLDLRGTAFETGLPSALFGTGLVTGFAAGGPSHLGVAGLLDSDYGVLTSNLQWSDASGKAAELQTFARADGNVFLRSVVDASTWTAWTNITAKTTRRRTAVGRKTNKFCRGTMIHGDGWAFAKSATEGSFFAVDTDGSGSTVKYFARTKIQLDATASGKTLYALPASVFDVNASQGYKVGFWGVSYGVNPLPVSINVKCYDINRALISTLTVSASVSSTDDPINSHYSGVINAIGGASPAFPSGTVGATVEFGFVSTAASGLHLFAGYMIGDDEFPGALTDSVANYGGGTHEAISDGTYLYVISHGLNRLTKFDGNLKKVATLAIGDYPHQPVVLGSALWVANFDAASVQKIDLGTFTVSATYSIPGSRVGFGLGTDGTNLWAAAGVTAAGPTIYSVNTSTGAFTALSTDVDGGSANLPIIYYNGSLWSLHQANSQIKRIDPATGATVATINVAVGTLYGLGAGDGYVFANGFSGVAQIDATSNAVVKTYPYHDLFDGESNVEVVGGMAYATAQSGVMAINYRAQVAEEILLDSGDFKWVRALPGGRVVAGAYSAPWMYIIDVN